MIDRIINFNDFIADDDLALADHFYGDHAGNAFEPLDISFGVVDQGKAQSCRAMFKMGNVLLTAHVLQYFRSVILDFIVGVFQPLIPAIAGAGMLKSLLLLLGLMNVLDPGSHTYKILFQIGDAALYFLPLLVAVTTANKLKVSTLVALAAVGALLLPNMGAMLGEGVQFFGFQVKNIAYAYQVFPAILTVLLYAQMEKWFTRISPRVIRIFFVPMMSLMITVPVSLLILGPLGYTLGEGFSSIILTLFDKVGWIAVALLAAVLPLMVSVGMHKALIPYSLSATAKQAPLSAILWASDAGK